MQGKRDEPRLTPTSYIVLGLLAELGEATPYDLKRAAAVGVGDFWSLQHAQFYTEPERLAAAGLLRERREREGRRRRFYALTDAGREALDRWLREPTAELTELRDPGLLRLYFGAPPAQLAAAQLEAHRGKLAEYEALRLQDGGSGPRGPWLALDAGIAHEREWVRFWSRVAESADGAAPPGAGT